MISPPPQHQKILHYFIFSADGYIPHTGRVAPSYHARAKTRGWECHWFRTTPFPRQNSSETHGFATDCTVKLFIIKNLFSAASLRCHLWICASIPSICLFSIPTFLGVQTSWCSSGEARPTLTATPTATPTATFLTLWITLGLFCFRD